MVDLPDRNHPDYRRLLYDVFGNSGRINQSESLFDYGPGESTETYTLLDIPSELVFSEDLDESTRTEAESICRQARVTQQPILDNCILDVGITNEPAYAAAAAEIEAVAQDTRERSPEGQLGCNPQQGRWSGIWQTSWNRTDPEDDPVRREGVMTLRLEQQGQIVTGREVSDEATREAGAISRIDGRADGATLVGSYENADGGTGRFMFTATDSESFKGRWRGDKWYGEWSGIRLSCDR